MGVNRRGTGMEILVQTDAERWNGFSSMDEERARAKTVFVLEIERKRGTEPDEQQVHNRDDPYRSPYSNTSSEEDEDYLEFMADQHEQRTLLRPPRAAPPAQPLPALPEPGIFTRWFGGLFNGSCMAGISSAIYSRTAEARELREREGYDAEAAKLEQQLMEDLGRLHQQIKLNEEDAAKHLERHKAVCADDKLERIQTCTCLNAQQFRRRCADIDGQLIPDVDAKTAQLRTLSETNRALRTEESNAKMALILQRGTAIMQRQQRKSQTSVDDIADILAENRDALSETRAGQRAFTDAMAKHGRRESLRISRTSQRAAATPLTGTAQRLVTSSAPVDDTDPVDVTEASTATLERPAQSGGDAVIQERLRRIMAQAGAASTAEEQTRPSAQPASGIGGLLAQQGGG